MVKCLLGENEDLSSDSVTHVKAGHSGTCLSPQPWVGVGA